MGIERLTTLAFSMYANKGAYALLLGAGISRSAKISSGWEVETMLIEQLAATQGITNIDDWHQWFKDTYGHSATYSSLLGELVKKPTERVQLMKPFFEPTDEEKELGLKEPTKAHEAIAKLAKNGYIRVVLTTNFDRLLERALEAEGIIPQVICHENDIEKSTPIVHGKAITIVKINGDYIDCRFRNTTEELDDYPESMKKYLCRIFEDYGLISCGWSATWDKGLVDILNGSSTSRYNSFFTSIGEPSDVLKTLATSRHGEIIQIDDADDLFTDLYEQITALEQNNVSRSMSHDIMVAKVKKYLSSEQYSIEYSDLIEKLGIEAYDKIIANANYNFDLTPEQFSNYLELHHNAVKPLIDMAILAVRWGKANHIEIFGEILVKLCIKPFKYVDYTTDGQYLHALGGTLLLNAVGIACVKYGRFTELDKILKLNVPAGNFMGFRRLRLLYLLGTIRWNKELLNYLAGINKLYPESFIPLEKLRLHFRGCFTVDSEYENTYYIWEHLKSLLFGYNRCFILDSFCVPTGQFLHSRNEYKMSYHGEEEPYTAFFGSADKLKGEWEPIKQGMFGGSYDEYKKIFDQTEEYYKQTMRH